MKIDRSRLLALGALLAAGGGGCRGIIGNVGMRPADGTAANGGGAATGTGAATGGGAMCGDGRIETGEACDGSNLGSNTCTSLGFQSGTLDCAASCQFDTSACEGPLALTVSPSRTSCTAPCGVFFDATSTTGLMNGDYVSADFNWDFDSTNVNPNGVHRQTIGFVAAHVFDVPGTYQVAVRVRDMAGRAGSTQVTITVSATTGSTIYVAANGSDQNSATTSTMDKPLATLATALAHAQAQTTILLRRGDTFNVGASTISLATTGLLLGAYGSSSAAAPIISSSATYSNYASIIDIGGASDVRVTDLHFVAAVGAFEGADIHGSANNLLLERVEIEGIGNPPSGAGEGMTIDNTSSPTFVVDCHFHDFNGDGIYADRPTHFALIGTTIERFGGTNHGVRVQGGSVPGNTGVANDTYIAENMIAPNPTKAAAFDATAIRGDNTNTVEVDNRMQRVIGFTPTADTELEHISNVLVEGNVLSDNSGPDMAYVAIGIIAQHVVVRNNVIINPDNAVQVTSNPLLPVNYVDQIYIYNNTVYMFPAAGVDNTYTINFLAHTVTTGNVVLEDNIWAEGMKNPLSSYVYSDGKGTETENYNLGFAPQVSGKWTGAPSGTGDVVGDPQFVSTDVTNSSAFRLSPGSPAIDVGTMTPAYQDLAGVPRPQGAAWDMGALEFLSSTGSPDASVAAAATARTGGGSTAGRRVTEKPAAPH